ncbi:tetratricopeptide repeat protein [Polyangium sorediatum]|uniref:Tetratricopeptide repeat protein n=1 Tax=Polyangium sorediatum TaxID=889274 RepID=A0ABT6NP84_9BACT|nr:serine/threonine-protein kinase [Polyangium sorediatum]MDI1430137.1 tetratricopeptide repeat protein [Polyangium sorediatum]
MSCLSDNTVAEFAEGLLETRAAERVEQHVASCVTCRKLLSELAKQISGLELPDHEASATDELRAGEEGRATPRTRALAAGAAPAGELSRGASLGRYMILETLGAGGMGVVFAAYDPELDRKVALKILRQEILQRAPGAELRLMREAQAMARISHPNVLAIHDVGTLGEGLFFAMEYVDGATLAGWLSQKERSWREILDLFEQAGRGLAAAHAAGLVHRDFKPENVLVARDGRVRVADFGLARALAAPPPPPEDVPETRGDNEALASLTRSGAVLGTPAYMAPEQFEGVSVDAQADQFSFCLALFEALYGERPFTVNTRETVLTEAPSGKLQRPKDVPGVPARVLRALERGLRPSPEERFPSMDALLYALTQDEQRTFRNRVLGALAVAAIGGVGVFGALRAAEPSAPLCSGAPEMFAGVWGEPQKRAIRERFLATELPYAKDAWLGTEQALDAYGRGWSTMHTEACEATRLRGDQSDEVLSLRMLCLDRRREEVRALVGVLETSGKDQVAKAPEATKSLGDVSVCADVEGLRSPVRLPERQAAADEAREIRAQIARASALSAVGRYQEGLSVAEATVTRAQTLAHTPTEAEALTTLADLQSAAGDPKAAEASLRRAFSAAQAGHDDRSAAYAAIQLVDVVGAQLRRFDEGLHWAWLAEAVLRRGKEDEGLLAQLHENRGDIYLTQADHARAGEQYTRSLELWQRVVGPQHLRVAAVQYNLGQVAMWRGDMAEAMSQTRRASEQLEALLGPNHPKIAFVLGGVATAHFNEGHHVEALAVYKRALAIQRAALGPAHVNVARTLLGMGHALSALHENTQALAAYQEALVVFEKDKSTLSLSAEVLLGISCTQVDAGRLEEALAASERALLAFEQVFGPEHDQVGAALNNMGDVLLELGRSEEAGARFTRAQKIWEKVNGPEDFQIGIALTGRGTVERRMGRSAQAVSLLEQAVKNLEKYDGNPVFLALARFELAQALWDGTKARDRAKQLATQAEKAFANLDEAQAKELVLVRGWLSRVAGR